MFNGVKGRPEDPTKRFLKWSKAILKKNSSLRYQAYVLDGFLQKMYRNMKRVDQLKYSSLYASMCSVCMRSGKIDHVNGQDFLELRGVKI